MRRQRGTALTASCGALQCQLRLALFGLGGAARDGLLEVLKGKLQLVRIELFGAPAKLHPLQLTQQVTQSIVLLGQPIALGQRRIALGQRRIALGRHTVQQAAQRFDSSGRGSAGTITMAPLDHDSPGCAHHNQRVSQNATPQIVEPLLSVRRVMRQQFAVLHKMLLDMVRADPVCRRLMTAPGVGAVVALTYRATVDQPQRFVHSRAVGAHVGLTPKRYQSGEIDYDDGVSKCGDALLRTMLYEAAHSLLTDNENGRG